MIKVALSMGKIKYCQQKCAKNATIATLFFLFYSGQKNRQTDRQRINLCSQLALPSRVLKEFQAVMFTAVEI